MKTKAQQRFENSQRAAREIRAAADKIGATVSEHYTSRDGNVVQITHPKGTAPMVAHAAAKSLPWFRISQTFVDGLGRTLSLGKLEL